MRNAYNTKFDTAEEIQEVRNSLEHLTEDRFRAALMGKKNIKEADIREMLALVTAATAKLQIELARLNRFAGDFNSQFVTRDNNRFSTAHALLSKLRSSTAGLKKVFVELTPNKAPHAYVEGMDKSLIYGHSAIGGAEYMQPLFPECFSPLAGELYNALRVFFACMGDALEVCQDVMDEEAEIRCDEARCVSLYEGFKEDHYSHIRSFLNKIDLLEDIFSSTDNGAIRLRETTTTLGEFSQQGYHSLNYDDVCTLATKELVEKDREGECTKEELWLFRGNKEKILRCRQIIQHIEAYLPEKKNRKRIPSDMVVYLKIWAEPVEEKAFVRYFKQTYEAAGGQLQVPTNSGVNQRNDLVGPEDEEYAELKKQWDAAEMPAAQKIA